MRFIAPISLHATLGEFTNSMSSTCANHNLNEAVFLSPSVGEFLMTVMVVDDGSPNATAGAVLGAFKSDSRSEELA